MKKRVVVIFFTLGCALSAVQAQEFWKTPQYRQQQRAYIAQDTQPVLLKELPREINSRFSEYNGLLGADSTFFFTSLREESEPDYEDIFDAYWSSKIYTSKLTIGGFSKPLPLPKSINSPKYYNSNFTFSEKLHRIYFTRCSKTGNNQLHCELWESRNIHGRWLEAEKLPRRINLLRYNCTQPFLVEDKGYDILYFVSDRPKGYGGYDIWYLVYENGKYGEPVNAGSLINSAGNEVTPFYDSDTKRLYFSSDTHLGIGGYDIFYSTGERSQWSAPQNIGVPYNSPYNDLYFTLNNDKKGGYISSNRPMQRRISTDTCCNDLLTFTVLNYNSPVPDTTETEEDTLTVTQKLKLALPITLYFDNDEPNPKSNDTTTKVNYRNTLADYIAMKRLYQTEYAKGLTGDAATAAAQTISRFFADSVEKGYRKLELMSSYLLQELQAGKDLTITISGFASALHSNDYNLKLSMRRIQSIVNYLYEYNDGALTPYLDGKRKNRLQLIRNPQGSSAARQKHISDNPNDKRNSIYSIAASLERKIEIVGD
jgi:outer membrane protein OmpA-like peptidoglycan-associated protein